MEKSYADFLSGLFDRKLDNDMNVIKKDKIIIKNPSPLIEKIIQKNETKLGRVKQDIENYVFLCQRSQISSASLVSVNTLLRQG